MGIQRPIDFVRGNCPQGWHVPSIDEYTSLANALNGQGYAGYEMKEIDTTHWLYPNYTNDTSQFMAFGAGGLVGIARIFFWLKCCSFFWTSTDYNNNTSETYAPYLQHDVYSLQFAFNNFKFSGYSVRCIRNY